ncbi:FOG: WD40 repeat [Solibacillus silvestris StLB046]|uniref:FOG: WD40 repeat n=1 Tax=Solibacillus silvestris (strain StLB046) TaxID=1002809 RepID=F2F2M5_SOLSS|nr:hypothetical protein [Solibacillus silvestris]BAK15863.1 FOG: WD40 repeat [Solibacillus silvestris StLB046]
MQYTNKLGLKKPDQTDYVNIADINENMDILDQEIAKITDEETGVDAKLTQHLDEDNENSHAIKNITGLQLELNKIKALETAKGQPNGYPSLNGMGVIPDEFLNGKPMKLIQETIVSLTTNTIQFTDLTQYKRLRFRLLGPTSTAQANIRIGMNINGKSNGQDFNYVDFYHSTAGVTATELGNSVNADKMLLTRGVATTSSPNLYLRLDVDIENKNSFSFISNGVVYADHNNVPFVSRTIGSGSVKGEVANTITLQKNGGIAIPGMLIQLWGA